MGQALRAELHDRLRRSWLRPALVSCVTAGLALGLAAPALGQDALSERAPAGEVCQVFALDGAEGGVKELRAACNGRGLILGEAADYRAVYNEALKATLVDMRREGERRLLLITIQDDGLPLLEDLSGQVALAAGRGPMAEIVDVAVDLEGFASVGQIAVHSGDRLEAARGEVSQLTLDEQIERERTR